MLKKKSKIFILLLSLIIGFNTNLFFNTINYKSPSYDIQTDIFDIKTSGPQINITTPENKTYTQVMSGYYPATYGFENDGIGDNPIEWTIDELGGSINVIEGVGTHNKVIEIHDTNNGDNSITTNVFSAQSSGTIEFWVRIDDATNRLNFVINSGGTRSVFCLIDGDYFQLEDSSGFHNVRSADDNTWYHIRIDFECGLGNYEGLSADTYYYHIDGERYGPYDFKIVQDTLNVTDFFSNIADSNYYCYYDAVGYSWDPNYNIGDNYQEGLLLSYDTSFTPDWEAYSLDGQTNRTISGNTTISFPSDDGVHTIQVFGNDSIGTMYESDIRYFSVKHLNIITPENKTYTVPMSGYYPGTYGFENDDDGTIPEDWTFEGGTYGSIQVIPSLGGHNKVVELSDTSGADNPYAKLNMSNIGETAGELEFWIRTDSLGDYQNSHYMLMDSVGTIVSYIYFVGSTDAIYYRTSSGAFWACDAVVDTWYHAYIKFNCSAGTNGQYDLWIDGDEIATNIEFESAPTDGKITDFWMTTYDTTSGYKMYLDALGYSWDPNYNIGDNYQEGILLSYDTSFTPDWQGYSLDGQANNTILGNTTIPFPTNDGLHTIQIFGNNSIGTVYESDIRYFTIQNFNIITPEKKLYTKPMSGYYPGTYGFENDDDGTIPEDWSFEGGAYGNAQVLPSLGGHNKVVELSDTSGTDNPYAKLEMSTTGETAGELEFWIRTDSLGDYENSHYMLIDSVGTIVSYIYFVGSTDAIHYRTSSGTSWACDAVVNTWYHAYIKFNCSAGTNGQYDLWIDGEEIASDIEFESTPTDGKITDFWMTTYDTTTGYKMYLDALGYSWDPNYNVGDNYQEGILLSYDTSFTPDWQGYSLDGQANITILGNTTFPFLNEGIHTIQLFGNDTRGISYQSEVKYFTIAFHPIVTVNSPNKGKFFGNAAPNFNISILESNLDTTWYTLNAGVLNITFNGLIGQINQTEWDKFSNGTIVITFYAKDIWGLEGSDDVKIWKDTYTPTSSIFFTPHSGINIVNESTEFSIIADDGLGSGVSFIRYKINDSNWITYTTPFTLANYPYGDKLISYQAIDKVDNYETIQTRLLHRTDTIMPTSLILFTPYEDPNIVIKSTTFTINADDGFGSGISLIRYKINDSIWLDYIGPFDLSNYGYGVYLISYQAIDVIGNIEVEHGIVVILVPEPSQPGISGYHLVITLGIIGVVSAILIKNRYKLRFKS